jgi:hypothetical protein
MAGAGRNMEVGLNNIINNLRAFRWISAYLYLVIYLKTRSIRSIWNTSQISAATFQYQVNNRSYRTFWQKHGVNLYSIYSVRDWKLEAENLHFCVFRFLAIFAIYVQCSMQGSFSYFQQTKW